MIEKVFCIMTITGLPTKVINILVGTRKRYFPENIKLKLFTNRTINMLLEIDTN